jgi:DNA-binding transcriptional regulator YhcF (GntR family)
MKMTFDKNQPLFMQIIQDFKQRLVKGSLMPGDKIPSVRELAAELGVTPNTLQRAFLELEREGFIRTERTSGRYATDDEKKLKVLRREMSREAVKNYIGSMNALGFSVKEAQEAAMRYDEEKEA